MGRLRQETLRPQAVLAYLSRYTHRVAISNSRLIALDGTGVAFKWKDCRIKGRGRLKAMTLDAAEFIRRFLLARAAERLPPHPPLRPVRRRRPSPQHRARPPMARSAQALVPERSRRGRQRDRNPFIRAPPPVLRRQDDHRRDVRGRARYALAEPDQDRQLMTVAAHPAVQTRSLSLPTARRITGALTSPSPKTHSEPRADSKSTQALDQKGWRSSVHPTRLRAAALRSDALDPTAIYKSP
jgi:hypothetical protein